MWYHENLIKGMMDFCKNIFPTVTYAYTSIPTYPGGKLMEIDEINIAFYRAISTCILAFQVRLGSSSVERTQ
jgi:hypothetical protein